MTELSAGRAVVELLKAEGVRHVFGIVGSTFLDVLDVLHDDPSVQYVNVRHEQGGAFKADGPARVTGTPAVCLVTSGPGATNLITGIAGAYVAHSPVVAIAGGSPLGLQGRDAFQELDALLPEADIVTLHVPYTPATRRMLSRERIARLRPGAIVINTARGEVVDEAALAEALDAGGLAGAGIDVFGGEPPPPDHPLLRIRAPGLVLTPHLAGSVFDNVASVARHAFRNIQRVLDGEPIPPDDLVTIEP